MIISICIPTYNRDAKLYKQLSIFYDQLKSHNYKYELIVSDNKSTDKTLAVIKKFKKKFSKLKNVNFVVNINKSNKGFTKNFIRSIDLASGQYSLILSDDDFPKKNFYKKLYEYIAIKKPKGLIFIPLSKRDIILNNKKNYLKKFTKVNQRSGTMSGIMFRTKFISKKNITNKTLYPQIHMSINYYLKFGLHHMKFDKYIHITQERNLVSKFHDYMNRPTDYGVLERFNIIETYYKKNKILFKDFFISFLSMTYWFNDIKYILNNNKNSQNVIYNINKSVFSKVNRKIIFFISNIFIIFLPLRFSGKFRLSFRIFVLRELLKNLVYKN